MEITYYQLFGFFLQMFSFYIFIPCIFAFLWLKAMDRKERKQLKREVRRRARRLTR